MFDTRTSVTALAKAASKMSTFIDLPKYHLILTEEYISERLTAWFNAKVLYKGCELLDNLSKKEFFTGDVLRIVIYGVSPASKGYYKVQVLLKTLPAHLPRRKALSSVVVFKNEYSFYNEILPELLLFQAEREIDDPFDNFARVFASYSDGQNDFIAVEDLVGYGYNVLDTTAPLDTVHCEMMVKMLAKFHGLSMAWKNQNAKRFEKLMTKIPECIFLPKAYQWYKRYWEMVCDRTIDSVSIEYPDTEYVTKVKEFATCKTFTRLTEAACNSKTYSALCHGKIVPNVVLVKYTDDGKTPVHMALTDFQAVRHSSPILDLSTCIFSCIEENKKKNNYETMVKIYHEKLSRQISDLGSDPTSIFQWHTFNSEVKKWSFFGLAASFEWAPCTSFTAEDGNMVIKHPESFNLADFWSTRPYEDALSRQREANNFIKAVDKGFIY